MLSASTFASSSSSATSSAGAFSASPGLSTPSSQYSHDSAGRKGSGNPLTELIETEQAYMETLKMIDSQIAPIWMKQMTSAAPDFSELLKDIHDILKVNKRFCMKLTRIAANPQTISELGDALMQWVNDLEVPYANYSRSFIPNLNQRSDILRNPSIQQLLQHLSASVSYEINLESLFNAPIQQLKYYKGLYSRLLEGTDPGRADHKLLTSANKRIDMIMMMSKGNNSVNVNHKDSSSNLPFIQTNFSANSDLTTFERQVDCSRTADLYSGTQINYQLRIAHPGAQLVMRDSFVMLPSENGPSIRVCLVLTTEVLVIARELSSHQFLLMYPAIPIGDITVKADALDREIVGEYILQFSVLGKKHLIMRADSKEIRSTWIGVEPDAPKSLILTPRTLSVAAQKKMLAASSSSAVKDYGIQLPRMPDAGSSSKQANIRNTDIFTYYSENGGVSPLESSDEEGEQDNRRPQGKSRDTIMDIYDNHFYDQDDDQDAAAQFPPPPVPGMAKKPEPMPQSVKILPHIPNVSQVQIHNNVPAAAATNEPTPPNKDRSNVNGTLPPNNQQPAHGPVKDSSHVQMTYIQPPTAQMSTMSISPPIPQSNQLNNSSPVAAAAASSSSSSTMNHHHHNNSNKINPLPASPNGASKNNMMMDGGKPASPRAVEVQRVVLPEMMQAVTQNTDDYLSSSSKPLQQQNDKSRFQPVANNGMAPSQQQPMPRSSSIRGPQQQQQQQRPPMMQNNSYPNQPQQHKPLPGQPQPQPQMMMMNNNQQQPPQNQYGYNARPMNSPPPPQHQYRPMNGGGGASPILANAGNNRRPPQPVGGAQPSSPRLQQPPGRFNSPSPSMAPRQMRSVEDFGSPPHSPNMYNPGNDVRQILYSSSQCDVFHWNNQSWYAAEGQCLLQVRLTHSNRTCVAVQLQNTGQLYLNAWILPNTVIRQPSPTDVNISLYMGTKKENYLIHFAHPQDATVFANILHKAHQDSNMITMQQQQQHIEEPLMDEPEVVDTINVPQTLKPVMQCKAKLFVKNETSNWSTFGNVTMRISQQSPSMRMLIQIENDKSKLVSAIVKSGNVEKISSKRISFLLTDEVAKTSIVYMIHLREDQTGNKIIEYLRTKNAENGW